MSNCCPIHDDTAKPLSHPAHEHPAHEDHSGHSHAVSGDPWFWAALVAIAIGSLWVGASALGLVEETQLPWLTGYGQAVNQLLAAALPGIGIGFVMIFILSGIAPTRIQQLMGHDQGLGGLWRAVAAGLLLDLCSHGILMVAAQLYRKGVGLPQVITFLVTSPWNSFSTLLILAGLVGWRWTLLWTGLSMVVGWVSGAAFWLAERRGWLPSSTVPRDMSSTPIALSCCGPDDPHTLNETQEPVIAPWPQRLKASWQDSQSLLKWLLLGIIITALVRTLLPTGLFQQWFGPTILGLLATMVAATIVEVCSEGSAPLAAELLQRAGAPGNGFAFLMAGASTDVTELLILRQVTGRWKTALFLPLVTVPQVLLLAWWINHGS